MLAFFVLCVFSVELSFGVKSITLVKETVKNIVRPLHMCAFSLPKIRQIGEMTDEQIHWVENMEQNLDIAFNLLEILYANSRYLRQATKLI